MDYRARINRSENAQETAWCVVNKGKIVIKKQSRSGRFGMLY